MEVLAVAVGNPKPRSRTPTVAVAVAERAEEAVALDVTERVVVDLAEFGGALFDWSSADVAAAPLRAAVPAIARYPG